MKTLLVEADKNFRITVPEDAKITFGPWSPPSKDGSYRDDSKRTGTLRVYQGTKDNIIACFSGVKSFRDLSMSYAVEVVREEGATVWKDDEMGYVREDKHSRSKEWIEPKALLTPATNGKKAVKRK